MEFQWYWCLAPPVEPLDFSDKEGKPMFNKMKTEYMSWIFLIGIVLLIIGAFIF